MRLKTKILLMLPFLVATFAVAQTYKAPPPFKHIVIIFQENRTPDNLFGAGAGSLSTCGGEDQFEPGVDIDNGGPSLSSKQNGGPYVTCLTPSPIPIGGGDHSHDPGWTLQYNLGAMDGACLETG